MKTPRKSPAARLTLVVEFDDVPDSSEVERIVEEGRAYGYVKQATWELLTLVKKELV